MPMVPGVDAVRLRENGIARDNVERSGDSTAAENEKPWPDVTRALARKSALLMYPRIVPATVPS
jgi:hypothetical protein